MGTDMHEDTSDKVSFLHEGTLLHENNFVQRVIFA